MKKIKKILIGTHNRGKYKEISALLPKGLKKISPIKFGIKPPRETGKTFKDNSVLKAKYFALKSGLYSISDDSGLEVAALKNRPGVYSARWAKKLGGFKKAMEKIIHLLKNKKKKRSKFRLCFNFSHTQWKSNKLDKKIKRQYFNNYKRIKRFWL